MKAIDYHTVAARDKERGLQMNPVQAALDDVPPDILELLCMDCPTLADGSKRDEHIGRWMREVVGESVDFDIEVIEKESEEAEEIEQIYGNPAYDLVAADRR